MGSPQVSDKIALLLRRGANVKVTGFLAETCLHLVLTEHDHKDPCWCDRKALVWRHLRRTKDIVILWITAGADVSAIDRKGRSVSDEAIHSGQQTLWTEALKYCGIDIRDVHTRRNVNHAYSTALSSEYSQPSRSVTSKISLEEYLERRKAPRVPKEKEVRSIDPNNDSSEDDESEDEDSDPKRFSSEGSESEDDSLADEASESSEMMEKEYNDEINEEITWGKAKLD